MLIAFVVLAVVMTTLAPGALPVWHRLGFITLLFFPAWLGWKSVLYQAPLLLNFGNGLAIGAITFLGLCFSNSIEAKLTTGAAHMIIGVVGSIVGYAIAHTMIAASDISTVRPSSRFRFQKSLTLLITMSVLLTLIFAGGRSYFARFRNSQIKLSETVGNWDATLFYEQTNLPWNLDRFLLDKVLIPKGICFYEQVPAYATSLLAQHDTITIVAFRGKNIDDKSLARIPKSLELEQLIFCNTRVTDDGMQLLLQWPRIVGLHLYDTPVTSLSIKQLAQRDSLKVIEVFGSEISPDEKEMIRQLRPKGTSTNIDPTRSGRVYPSMFPRYLRAMIYGDAPHPNKKLRTIDLRQWRLWLASNAFK